MQKDFIIELIIATIDHTHNNKLFWMFIHIERLRIQQGCTPGWPGWRWRWRWWRLRWRWWSSSRAGTFHLSAPPQFVQTRDYHQRHHCSPYHWISWQKILKLFSNFKNSIVEIKFIGASNLASDKIQILYVWYSQNLSRTEVFIEVWEDVLLSLPSLATLCKCCCCAEAANQRLAWFSVNQSEISMVKCQPIRD